MGISEVQLGEIECLAARPDPVHVVIANIIKALRSANRKFSLAYIAQRSGLPSRSNLNDFLQGRRRLPKKYRESLLAALGISGITATFLNKRLEAAGLKVVPGELEEEIRILGKALGIRVVESGFAVSAPSFKLFCALGLLRAVRRVGDDALVYRESELKTALPGWSPDEIETSLVELVEAQAIERGRGTLRILSQEVLFGLEGEGQVNVGAQMAKQLLYETMNHIDEEFSRSDTHFSSTIISIRRDKYLRALASFREELIRFQADIETDEADDLASISVQIYPLRIGMASAPAQIDRKK